jgi:uncharacterized membrane protein
VNRVASPDDVLCIRRHQPTRLEGFIDSSFAFAVTLLVISIGHIPASVPEMLHALRGLPAFAISFLLIARIWMAHRDWSRRYDIEDATSVRLSLLLVFLVLIFVYPLRLLFSLFFYWISHGYLVDQELELHSAEELRVAFEVYGIGFGSIAVVMALLYRHALRAADQIGLTAREHLATRMHLALWLGLAGLAAISILCAVLLPFNDTQPLLGTLPGFVYAFSGVRAKLIRRHYAARIAAIPA